MENKMNFIDTFYSKVEHEVENLQSDIFIRVADRMETLSGSCSYRSLNAIYVAAKLRHRKFELRICNEVFSTGLNLDRQLDNLRMIRDDIQARMYKNPCKICKTCKGRKKQWKS